MRNGRAPRQRRKHGRRLHRRNLRHRRLPIADDGSSVERGAEGEARRSEDVEEATEQGEEEVTGPAGGQRTEPPNGRKTHATQRTRRPQPDRRRPDTSHTAPAPQEDREAV